MANPANVRTEVIYVLGGLIFVIIVILITREYWCWYFKINRIERLLREIVSTLKESKALGPVDTPSVVVPPRAVGSEMSPHAATPAHDPEHFWRCSCGSVNPRNGAVCWVCQKPNPDDQDVQTSHNG
jgi:hypothetical protein